MEILALGVAIYAAVIVTAQLIVMLADRYQQLHDR
jgi:hypothetical protein